MLRVDHYTATAGGMVLGARETMPTDYDSRNEEWFQSAVAAKSSTWIQLPHLPNSERNAITTAIPVFRNGALAGVANIAIEVDRLSRFLAGVRIGRTGSAAILDPTGYVVAYPDAETIRLQEGNATPSIDDLAGRDAMFRRRRRLSRQGQSRGDRHPPADPDQGRRRRRRPRLFHRARRRSVSRAGFWRRSSRPATSSRGSTATRGFC